MSHPDIKIGDKLELYHPWIGEFESKCVGFDKMYVPGFPGCKWIQYPLPKTKLIHHVACCSDRIIEV